MRVGLVVSRKSRELFGDDLLVSIYEESKVPYVAEMGDYLAQDVKENDLQGLLIVSEERPSQLIERADEVLGLNPLAIEHLPLRLFSGKPKEYTKAVIKAYLAKLSLQDGVYKLQPVRAVSVSRRALIKFRLYEYREYPVLYDALTFEKEINTLTNSCPKGLIAKSIEGVTVTSPSDCSSCGYCTAKGYLGYLEMPTFTTDQFAAFVNTIVENYPQARGLAFTKTLDLEFPDFVVPLRVPSLASVPDQFVFASFAVGLVPVLITEGKLDEVEMKRLEEVPNAFPGTQLKVYKGPLSGVKELPVLPKSRIPEDVIASKFRRRSLYVWSIQEMSRKVQLDGEAEVPEVYYVEVDPEKCVLCGVCVRACQMMVPDMRTENELTYLEYNIPFCIGSQRCVRSCPENAIKVERLAKVKELKKFRYSEAKVLRCRFCGKPIGNVKIKGRVDQDLIKYGHSGTAQYTDVCNECKQKHLTKIWLENYLRLRGELRR